MLVAVYNAEQYLHQSLDSLVSQSFRNIQILCVDDASTDSSLDILNQYARADERIKVIHLPENRGQAHARNIGLAQADGDLIGFLDSDDRLSSDAIESAVRVFEQHPETDCVLFHAVNEQDEGHQSPYPMTDFEYMSGFDAFRKSLDWTIHGLYMVRADIHHRIPYDETCHSYSDDNTTRMHYFASREVRLCGGIYYYSQHPESVTHQVDIHRFDYLEANLSMKRWLIRHRVSEEVLNLYENCRWLNLIDVYMFYFKHRRELGVVAASSSLVLMHRVWKGMETRRLRWSLKCKFGYMPLRCSWALFRLQEEIYFSLKKLLGR